MTRAILLFLLALLGAVPAAAKPQRIVSLNLCTDQLVMQLAERRNIAAVTWLAADPASSAMASEVRGLSRIRGTAEEVVALRPDLIVAGPFSTRETVSLLRRLGYDVVEFAPASSLAAIRANIEAMGRALGEPERTAALLARFDARLAASAHDGKTRPLFADYGPNGYTSGSGTLIADLARHAGFAPLGERLRIAGMRQLPLEQLVLARPQLIDLGDRAEAPALSNQIYQHPALARLVRGGRAIRIPSRLTACGTLRTLDALAMLANARERFE